VRLFAAVDPPPAETAALDTAIGERLAELRRVPVHQWHLTTAFYGEVADDVVPELVERLGRVAARTEPMTLRLSGAGTFPKQAQRARVLWVGLDGDVATLTRLADRCVAAGRRCGLAMEDRAFRPHLTLARTRKEPADLRDVVAALASYAGRPWTPTALRLVHSTLGPPTTHETIESFTLSEGRAAEH
jgi:2'-5' RNA ligase